ncbi:transporter [uncultured Rhodoblastus sp.]|uniref:SphA family protein n=1 Tax=uncultured Rhodoblastus sp. TaxID=543037 RepID=UPI0025E1EB33|nr:transporter [uncultured Rhodoblastus sp.]
MLTLAAAALNTRPARADESGISFWLPGLFGSLAAVPTQPGFNFATFNYYTSVNSATNVKFQIGARLVAGVEAHVDFQYLNLNYVFATPVFGGQAAIGINSLFGNNATSVFGTLTGPNGGALSGGRQQSSTGFGDLYPLATIKWNQGVNNFMVYAAGDIPVGLYSADNIANLGIGHGAIDSGLGYTYFNPQTGNELSAVTGFTYNMINQSTNYQNGVDWHLDWAASHFLTPNVMFGVVGYFYDQLTGDSGSGAKLGPFESRVVGVGPQLGVLFPVAGMQGYLNAKGYAEFDAHARPSGHNLWLTLSISPAVPRPPSIVATN